jgi:hypothetical protein
MIGQLRREHFNSGLRVQMNVLPQVDFGEVPSPKKMDEAVVTKLLSHTISHPRISS